MKLFFSWQSDKPEVQKFIRVTLQKLCNELEIEYDEDSRGEDAAEYILDNILRKIDNSTIVVGDLTSVGQNLKGENTPNPNVCFEVGYAEARVTRKNLILVFCLDFGGHDDLPFDLSKRSMPSFSLKSEESKKVFEARMKKAIQKIIATPQESQAIILNKYEKDILYWTHTFNQPVHDDYGQLVIGGMLDESGAFNEQYDDKEHARYSHALNSLVSKELLLKGHGVGLREKSYLLSAEGETIAQNIKDSSLKKLYEVKN